MNIHPTALVDPQARVEEGVRIGPYCVIGPQVRLGAGTELVAHVVIDGQATIGRENRIYPFASLGSPPQDLTYGGEPTRVEVGDRNVIREYVTINRGTAKGGGVTRLGSGSYLMAYAHVAHDCQVGDRTLFGNAASLAGHVIVQDDAKIGPFSGVHQFCRIGRHGFLGGYSAASKDVLPYSKTVGNRARAYGANLVGLRRAGMAEETLEAIARAFRLLLGSKLNTTQALERIRREVTGVPEVEFLVRFVEESERGVIK